MSKITIINYGAGNLLSVKNMLRKARASEVLISDKLKDIEEAEKLILPGVGHFDYGIAKIKESGLIPTLTKKITEQKTPILGICLGAQLMTKSSEEGMLAGLGWVNGKTVAFDKTKVPADYKVPHMGWNEVEVRKNSTLFSNMPPSSRFYFVHSYHLEMENEEDVWLTANYGYDFCAAYQSDNIYACQFHPEKSHKFGLQLMRNFTAL